MSSFRKISYFAFGSLLAISGAMIVFNGKTLARVSIKLKPDAEDHLDKRIPLISKPGDELPDYSIQYLVENTWHNIGTKHNQSATQWLHFQISDQPNLDLVQSVRVIEDDRTEDDILDEVSVLEMNGTGTMFEFEFEHGYTVKAGLDWFASTALGKAVLGAISLAVFFLLISVIG